MKAIAQQPRPLVLAREGVASGDGRHPTVERGIEAGDLRHVWIVAPDRLDRRERLRQMIGVDRDQRAQVVEQRGGEPFRLAMALPAVDDPVPDRRHIQRRALLAQPIGERGERGGVIGQIALRIEERLASCVGDPQSRVLVPDPLGEQRDFAPLVGLGAVDRRFQA